MHAPIDVDDVDAVREDIFGIVRRPPKVENQKYQYLRLTGH